MVYTSLRLRKKWTETECLTIKIKWLQEYLTNKMTNKRVDDKLWQDLNKRYKTFFLFLNKYIK